MQGMLLTAWSTQLIFFPVPEGILINRPLSAAEKSLTVEFASNVGGNSVGNSAANICKAVT